VASATKPGLLLDDEFAKMFELMRDADSSS